MTEAVITTPAAKVDPETLAIRAKPARAIRFQRGVIIAIAGAGSVSLIAVAWVALKPRVFQTVADRPELSQPADRPPTDALGRLPATYGDVPKLGPPLPGDLGRPILEHQRAMATPPAPPDKPRRRNASACWPNSRRRGSPVCWSRIGPRRPQHRRPMPWPRRRH